MFKERFVSIIFIIAINSLLMLGCSSPATLQSPQVEPTKDLPDIATLTKIPPTTTSGLLATKTPSAFPLSQPGPYLGGYLEYSIIDESRGEREIRVTLWYPALRQPNSSGYHIKKNAPVDASGAPYKLILTGPASGDEIFSSHLATHGFVMAIVRFPDEYDSYDLQAIDDPRDILFVLDQLAEQPPEELAGLIDTDHTGVTGFSLDGYNALAVSGARWNPEHYFTSCQDATTSGENRPKWQVDIFCNPVTMWDEFAATAGEKITSSQDGLWQPLTDERIHAVAPLAPDGAWFFGERGLAEIDIPVFIICGTQDNMPSYQYETVFIYENLKTPEKYLVSFIGKGHAMTFEAEQVMRMNHFVTAFFGYYLQGRSDYAWYFSEEFVSQFDDLAWGVYRDNE